MPTGAQPPAGKVASASDNAAMESLFSLLQKNPKRQAGAPDTSVVVQVDSPATG